MFRELRPGTRNGDERERRPKTVWNVDLMLPEPEDGSKKIQAGHTSVNASRASAAGGQHRRQVLWTPATRQHEAARSTPGPCASALARPPSPARRRCCPRRRSPAHGRGAQAAIMLLAMAQQEARLALTHGLLDLGASASPVQQRLPWSSTPSVRPPSGS